MVNVDNLPFECLVVKSTKNNASARSAFSAQVAKVSNNRTVSNPSSDASSVLNPRLAHILHEEQILTRVQKLKARREQIDLRKKENSTLKEQNENLCQAHKKRKVVEPNEKSKKAKIKAPNAQMASAQEVEEDFEFFAAETMAPPSETSDSESEQDGFEELEFELAVKKPRILSLYHRASPQDKRVTEYDHVVKTTAEQNLVLRSEEVIAKKAESNFASAATVQTVIWLLWAVITGFALSQQSSPIWFVILLTVTMIGFGALFQYNPELLVVVHILQVSARVGCTTATGRPHQVQL